MRRPPVARDMEIQVVLPSCRLAVLHKTNEGAKGKAASMHPAPPAAPRALGPGRLLAAQTQINDSVDSQKR